MFILEPFYATSADSSDQGEKIFAVVVGMILSGEIKHKGK
jgi:hypothetical protein